MPIIYGPTAVGKTELALQLASYCSDIISADSRQIYRYLDIGTGKDVPLESVFVEEPPLPVAKKHRYHWGYWQLPNGQRLWLLDLISPRRHFSAYLWAEIAGQLIGDLFAKRKQPLVVGGSGFYIKVLLDGLDVAAGKSDWKRRNYWQKQPLGAIQKKLKEIWPDGWRSLNRAERQNKQRLARKLEIVQKNDWQEHQNFLDSGIIPQGIGLLRPWLKLKKYVRLRTFQRIERGLLLEIQKVLGRGYSWRSPGLNTLAYKEWQAFFRRRATFWATLQEWQRDEIRYARRQRLWFRHDRRFRWFNGDGVTAQQAADILGLRMLQ